MILIILPREVQSGNALAYAHWRSRMRDRDTWMTLLRRDLGPGTRMPPGGRQLVTITAYRGRKLDSDNLSGGCKHLRDCLVRVGLIEDDSDEHAEFVYVQRPKREGPGKRVCTTIQIERAAPTNDGPPE